jgi:hypothetical protein
MGIKLVSKGAGISLAAPSAHHPAYNAVLLPREDMI